jgi:hypothetical protein
MKLTNIDTVDHITKDDFTNNYLKKNRPLIIKNYAEKWPASDKWSPEYLKSVCGDKVVPLYDSSKADPSKAINAAQASMRFEDYVNLITSQPSELRIFAFNIFNHAPGLLDDYLSPKELMGGFLDKFPYMFFGGKGSKVFLHYDIDLPHIFQVQFYGRKRVVLFDQKWSKHLYRIPMATYALEDYDLNHPDFTRFPALREVEGCEGFLDNGDMLFMPSGLWHYMEYIEGGYAISLRAWDTNWFRKLHSLYNLVVMRNVDSFLKILFKEKYFKIKEKLAYQIAEKQLKKTLQKNPEAIYDDLKEMMYI